jgi:hypothetical protein
MRWSLFLLLGALCTSPRVSHYRSGMGSCRAADPNIIECGGKQMAQVECFQPGDETCGALAVHYADGERVFLWRPAGFEPGHEAALDPAGVLRPELSSNGKMIWFKPARERGTNWTVFEPGTGVTRQITDWGIFGMRENDPHSMPLWVVTIPK